MSRILSARRLGTAGVLAAAALLSISAIGFGVWATLTNESALFGRQSGLAGIYSLVLAALVAAVPLAVWGIRQGRMERSTAPEAGQATGQLMQQADRDAGMDWFVSTSNTPIIDLFALLKITADAGEIIRRWTYYEDKPIFATLGVMCDSKPLELNMTADGPCGIVLGYSGSGTSELLRTICMSMALTFRPDRIRLHLIDFKGGATWHQLRSLPHVQQIFRSIRDEDSRSIIRDLMSLVRDKEYAVLSSRANSIEDHNSKNRERRLPWDLIVVDELSGNYELLEGLEEIQRRGRALGVCLIVGTARLEVTYSFQALSRFTVLMGDSAISESRDLPDNFRKSYNKTREAVRERLPVGRAFLVRSGYFVDPFQAAISGRQILRSSDSPYLVSDHLEDMVAAVRKAATA